MNFFFCCCCCCHCVSPIRTYIVQKQAQEQELFPPVKWVCVCSQSSPSVTLDLLKRTSKQKKKVVGGLCKLQSFGLFVNFHTFFLHLLCLSSVSYYFVNGNCSLLGTQFHRRNLSVLSVKDSMAFCVDARESCMRGETSPLNAQMAWRTRLFLVGDTGKLGKHLHNGTPPLSDPYFYQASRRWALWLLFPSKCWTSPFPLHFQPGNLHSSPLLSSMLPLCLLFCRTPALLFSLLFN